MHLKLYSTNENMSWAIGKNPDGLPVAKSIRKGYGLGYYMANNPQAYNAVFMDSPDEISYPSGPKDEFAYLHPGELVSPFAALGLTGTIFGKIYEKYDVPADQMLVIEAIEMKERTVDLLASVPGFTIETRDWVYAGYKTVIIHHYGTLAELFDFTNVLCLQAAFDNRAYIDKSDDLLTKYIKSLLNINAPYMVRYTFKVNLLTSYKTFEDFESVLSSGSDITFKYGNTQRCRMDWIKEQFKADNLIDLGCGEGDYFRFEKKFKRYLAVDINPEVLEYAKKRRLRKYPDSKIEYYGNIQEVPLDFNATNTVDILLSEVIEHIPLSELAEFLHDLEKLNPSQIIITTPNAAFNKNYGIPDDEMRTEFHEWEMNVNELNNWLIENNFKNFTIYKVGDIVGEESVTTGVIIRGNDES